jgi:hypothetical protein
MGREGADASFKIYEKFRDNGAGHRGDADMYEYRAMGCLTNARNQKILTVVFSMNGAPLRSTRAFSRRDAANHRCYQERSQA